MKYYKQFLLLVLFVLFSLIVWYGFTEGLTYLFTFPIFAVGIFLTFYLSKEFEQDNANQLKKGVRFAKEDQEAEVWVGTNLAPDTLRYIKTRRWMIIGYCLFFFLLSSFLWSFLNNNLLTAVRDLSYIGVMSLLFILYILFTPSIFERIEKRLPKSLQQFMKGDWTRGYLFLLPITFVIYVMYPYEEVQLFFSEKILSFPLFFIVYTFTFVALYCIVYLHQSFHTEENNRLTNTIKKSLNE